MPTWTLGDRLTKARRDAGLGQGDMAEQLGVSRTTVSAWENDVHKPVRGWNLLTLTARWAEITGVDLEWIMWGTPYSACWVAVEPALGQGDLFEAALPPPELEVIVTSAAG